MVFWEMMKMLVGKIMDYPVVKKPVKSKPPVPEWEWRLGDWTDLFDEDAPMSPPEDIEKVLNIKKREVAGLESLLRLHKKFSG